MIVIAIVEDSDDCAVAIKGFIERFSAETREEISTVRYRNGMEFVTDYNGSCDIVLLDIEMPLLNGMDAAKELRKTGDRSPVIFITNMAQYAVKGYEVDAIGFIVKPVAYYAFSDRMKKAVAAVKARRDNFLAFTLKDGLVKIYLDDIKYVEVNRHRILYHTFDGVTEVRGTMRETAEKLNGKSFAQCNSCWLVNLKYVTEVKSNIVRVAGEELLVSRNKRREFLNRLTVYLAGGVGV